MSSSLCHEHEIILIKSRYLGNKVKNTQSKVVIGQNFRKLSVFEQKKSFFSFMLRQNFGISKRFEKKMAFG